MINLGYGVRTGNCKPAAVAAVFLLPLVGGLQAAELKVVTEYRYPTAYEVIPIQQFGGAGGANTIGALVIPKDFETREVGVLFRVEAIVVPLGGLAAMTDGVRLINGNTELIMVATAGDYKATRALLERGAPVNAANRFGSTPLIGASAGGFRNIVSLLLDKGADPNAKSREGITPLIAASKNGHYDVVKALLAAGASVDGADSQGRTALMHAINADHPQVAQALLERGARTSIADIAGATPIALARQSRNPEMVLLLTRFKAE